MTLYNSKKENDALSSKDEPIREFRDFIGDNEIYFIENTPIDKLELRNKLYGYDMKFIDQHNSLEECRTMIHIYNCLNK